MSIYDMLLGFCVGGDGVKKKKRNQHRFDSGQSR